MESETNSINRIDAIREEISSLTGSKVFVKANLGRSRIIERTGELIESHPSLFVVEVEEGRGRKARQSYQYVDVLTNTVELSNPETGESLLESLREA